MDNDPNACGFGITIGVIAFLALIVFLIIDARFDSLSSVKIRRRAVIADMGFSGSPNIFWKTIIVVTLYKLCNIIIIIIKCFRKIIKKNNIIRLCGKENFRLNK
jgi:hypothetical protein